MASVPLNDTPQRQNVLPELGGKRIAWSAHRFLPFTLAIAAGVLAFLQVPSATNGQEPVAPPAEPLTAIQVLQRASQARLGLTRGEFRATGQWSYEPRQESPPQEILRGTTEFYCAFDTIADRTRFDRHDDEVLRTNAGQVTVLNAVWRRYVNTPDMSAWWSEDSRFALIRARNAPPPSRIAPYDVRLLGMLPNVSLDQTFRVSDRVLDRYMQRTNVTIDHEGDGIVRLTWIEPTPPVQTRTRIWFDVETDYSPIRYESTYSRSIETPFEWREPQKSVRVTWQRTSVGAVPVSYTAIDRSWKRVQRTLVLLEWTSINEPLDDDTFTLDGFDLPPGVAVVDNRSGKNEVVER